MKIGILNSDTVQIDGAMEFGQYPDMFSKIFWAVDPDIQFQTEPLDPLRSHLVNLEKFHLK